MATAFYDLTVPVLLRALRNLSAILEKGRVHAEAQGLAPDVLLQARLFEDMAPLTSQVQRVSDAAKGALVRIGQVANVAMDDTETTFEQLQARIAATIAFVEAVPREAVDGREDAEIILQIPNAGSLTFTGRDYVLGFVLPNVFFHVTTAYAILRHNGVPLGKRDYLGGI
ncbi:hypothetical protein CSW58_02950 [Caulobacter sp. B11]|uniref:DUF1993 domain-containing protein n=1 Tax=Caulobacter sp. B11 TaxID=2048899 RepID=UPI000C12AE6A|nr:DUF1993 domain-containing protein [Caulobacter sp. B11]PHY13871.1 hypothetical protein CSW58_02950 [Caulobacter sp. B11]